MVVFFALLLNVPVADPHRFEFHAADSYGCHWRGEKKYHWVNSFFRIGLWDYGIIRVFSCPHYLLSLVINEDKWLDQKPI